jgi:hypothetical protein
LKDVALKESDDYNSKLFLEHARRGLDQFKSRDLKSSISSLQRAREVNSTQPLGQLGIFLYIDEQYESAASQLSSDAKKVEEGKQYKATDYRIWWSACLRKQGKLRDAIDCLDLNNVAVPDFIEERLLMNYTLSFFAEKKNLDEMMLFIGNADEKDFTGRNFFGNFYLGLYYDSIGNTDLAQLFLSLPARSRKFNPNDMWYHLPRVYFEKRFGYLPD